MEWPMAMAIAPIPSETNIPEIILKMRKMDGVAMNMPMEKNTKDSLKKIKKTVMGNIILATEIYMMDYGQTTNAKEKERKFILMGLSLKENGRMTKNRVKALLPA